MTRVRIPWPGTAAARSVRDTRAERDVADRERALVQLRTRVASGSLDVDALTGLDGEVADLVALAGDCGAPLAPVVQAGIDGAEQRRRTEAELVAAIAPAHTVARTLVALPLVAVPGLAALTGTDLAGFYLRDPVGRLVLVAVAVLLAVAATWMHAILLGARRVDRPGDRDQGRRWWLLAVVPAAWLAGGPVPGLLVAAVVAAQLRTPAPARSPHLALAADLVAVAVSAGHDLPSALRLAGDRVERPCSSTSHDAAPSRSRTRVALALRSFALDLALRPDHHASGSRRGAGPGETSVVLGPLADVVVELVRSGAPGADVLRHLAARLRADHVTEARAVAARLPARLTFPTALVLVPATVLAIGAPIVLQGLARATGP